MLGVPTGAAQLDSLLGCFTAGVDLLAGPPGMGKTTLALQIVATATRESMPDSHPASADFGFRAAAHPSMALI